MHLQPMVIEIIPQVEQLYLTPFRALYELDKLVLGIK